MIITHVRAVQPDADRAPAGWRGTIGQILVRIDTDDGLSGYGVGGGGPAGIHVVQTVLREVWSARMPGMSRGCGMRCIAILRLMGARGLR